MPLVSPSSAMIGYFYAIQTKELASLKETMVKKVLVSKKSLNKF